MTFDDHFALAWQQKLGKHTLVSDFSFQTFRQLYAGYKASEDPFADTEQHRLGRQLIGICAGEGFSFEGIEEDDAAFIKAVLEAEREAAYKRILANQEYRIAQAQGGIAADDGQLGGMSPKLQKKLAAWHAYPAAKRPSFLGRFSPSHWLAQAKQWRKNQIARTIRSMLKAEPLPLGTWATALHASNVEVMPAYAVDIDADANPEDVLPTAERAHTPSPIEQLHAFLQAESPDMIIKGNSEQNTKGDINDVLNAERSLSELEITDVVKARAADAVKADSWHMQAPQLDSIPPDEDVASVASLESGSQATVIEQAKRASESPKKVIDSPSFVKQVEMGFPRKSVSLGDRVYAKYCHDGQLQHDAVLDRAQAQGCDVSGIPKGPGFFSGVLKALVKRAGDLQSEQGDAVAAKHEAVQAFMTEMQALEGVWAMHEAKAQGAEQSDRCFRGRSASSVGRSAQPKKTKPSSLRPGIPENELPHAVCVDDDGVLPKAHTPTEEVTDGGVEIELQEMPKHAPHTATDVPDFVRKAVEKAEKDSQAPGHTPSDPSV